MNMAGVGNFIKSIPGLLFLLIISTILGALFFQYFEAPYEVHSRTHISKTRQKIFILAQQLAKKGDQADWSKLVAQVDRYREKLYETWQAGTDELTIDIPNKWSFWGSIYYCFTLYTTIGYGNIFPATTIGKLLTMIYGLLTIPLCSLLLSRMSAVIVRLIKAIHSLTLDSSSVPIGLREAYHRADTQFDFRIFPCILTLIIYLILGSGLKQYNLGLLDSIYFAFVSITTIGFGDLIPGTDAFLAILSVCYILVGLSLGSIIFGRLTSGLEDKITKLGMSQGASSENLADGPKQGAFQVDMNSSQHRSQTSATMNANKHLKQL